MPIHPDEKPLDTRRPFTRAEAVKAGLNPSRLYTQAFRKLFHRVYVDASVPVTPLLRAQGALKLFPGTAWASHATAGRIHGVPLPALPEEHVSVLHAKERRYHEGIRSHVANRAIVQTVGGINVSSCGQAFVELAGLLDLVELVVVGDDMVRRKKIPLKALIKFCDESTHRNAARARRAVAYVREKVDSPMETRLRMLLVLAGLPEPEVNLEIRTDDGIPVRRYDLSYPAVKAIVEYDGRQHIEREENWESDLDRREAIDDDGWRILVVTSKGIYSNPERTLVRVHRLLKARGMPGLPSRLNDEWRQHFPGHNR